VFNSTRKHKKKFRISILSQINDTNYENFSEDFWPLFEALFEGGSKIKPTFPIIFERSFQEIFFNRYIRFPSVYHCQCDNLTLNSWCSSGGAIVCLFIMATEYVGPNHRAMAGTFTWYFWTGALMLIALLAYLVRDWRKLSMITSAPGLVLFVFWM